MSLSLCPRWRNKMYLFIYLFIYTVWTEIKCLLCSQRYGLLQKLISRHTLDVIKLSKKLLLNCQNNPAQKLCYAIQSKKSCCGKFKMLLNNFIQVNYEPNKINFNGETLLAAEVVLQCPIRKMCSYLMRTYFNLPKVSFSDIRAAIVHFGTCRSVSFCVGLC